MNTTPDGDFQTYKANDGAFVRKNFFGRHPKLLEMVAKMSDEDIKAFCSLLLAAGAALLVVKRGPNAGSRFLLDQETTSAGRHPDSDIFLDDVTVSRRHAEFRSVEGGFTVVDVGSLNGTYVNREPVDASPLAHGDEVQIGKFRLVFYVGTK